MYKYIINVNAQPTGEHEVHLETICGYLPLPKNRFLVGHFDTCKQAIVAAKAKWPNASIDGCEHCVPTCHTR